MDAGGVPEWVYGAGGTAGLVAVLYWAFIKSWIWTSPQVIALRGLYEERQKAQDEQAKERIAEAATREKEWRVTAENAIATNEKLTDQLEVVIKGQEAIQSLLVQIASSRRQR